jgi:hypothetical protein
MTLDEIRTFQKQEPFEPFEIVMVDGRVFHVPHPELIWVPPGRGTWVYVADPGSEAAHHISIERIETVRPREGAGRAQVSDAALTEIEEALVRYRKEVSETAMRAPSRDTYIRNAEMFVRWLRGEFEPGARLREV